MEGMDWYTVRIDKLYDELYIAVMFKDDDGLISGIKARISELEDKLNEAENAYYESLE